jgi:pilus assembly protein CpaB
MASNKTDVRRSRSGHAFLFLALIFAAVAAVLVFVAVNQGGGDKEEAGAPSTTKAVVVASKDIAARTELTGEMLSVKKVPEDEALRGAFTDTEQVAGQVTRQDILEGEQVTATKIGPQTKTEREGGLSFVIPQGMRAFSIQVDETSAVGGLILPGDLVDIIAIFDKADFDVDKAVTLLQNIEVLAVAQESQESIPAPTSEEAAQATATPESNGTAEQAASNGASLGTRPEDAEPNPKARTVTLAVSPEQAQLLALTQARGELALALRAFGDSADVSLNETTLIPMGAHPEGQ